MNTVEQLESTRHDYRVKAWTALPVLLAIVIAVLIPWIYFADGIVPAALFGVLSIVGAFALCVALQRSRLTIEGSRLEVRGPGQNRSVDRNEIEGTRTFSGEHDTYRALCLKDGSTPIRFSQYATDGAFNSWLGQIPDLDQRDREHVLEEISADESLGATREDRLAALVKAKQVNIGLWILTAAAAAGLIWGGAVWRTLSFWTLAAMPIAAAVLLIRFPLLFTLSSRGKDPRAQASGILLIAGMGLFIFSNQMNFVSRTGLLHEAAFVALFWMAGFVVPTIRSAQRNSAILMVGLAGMFYSWGVTASADVAADKAARETYMTMVADKYTTVTQGRSRRTIYHLRVEPWGPYPDRAMSMHVPKPLYDATHVHDRVCIDLHPGWLDTPWFEPVACPGNSTP